MLLNSHQSIISIDQLIHQLNSAKTVEQYNHILNSFNLNRATLRSYCSWDNCSYTRNIITRNPSYELLIICWQKSHSSAIHNHGKSQCWMSVIQGKIGEKRYETTPNNAQNQPTVSLKQIACHTHYPGKISTIKNHEIWHSLQALSPKAITLHLYSPPLHQFSIYDAEINSVRQQQYS